MMLFLKQVQISTSKETYTLLILPYTYMWYVVWYIICDRRISAFGEPQRLSYVAHGLWNRFRWSCHVRIRSDSFIIWFGPWKGAHSYGLLHMCWQINLITRSSTKNVSKFARVYMDEKKWANFLQLTYSARQSVVFSGLVPHFPVRILEQSIILDDPGRIICIRELLF